MERKMPESLFLPHGKKAVLLLHAYSGSPNDVRMLARYLEKADYTIYAPLFTGHGTFEPLDILQTGPDHWLEDSRQAVAFLKEKGYQEIAVFGLSLGGIFAMRLLEELELKGGGFFCSPIAPVTTHVTENFLAYVQQVRQAAGETKVDLERYRPLVEVQVEKISDLSQQIYQQLHQINKPVFLAQAGQDDMIDSQGVFQTAKMLQHIPFTLKWYPNSGHVVTVSKDHQQLEKDVAAFLESLTWENE